MEKDTLIPWDRNRKNFMAGIDSNGDAQAIAVSQTGQMQVTVTSWSPLYDTKSFVLPALTTDYDVKANQASLFLNVPTAGTIEVVTSNTISIRFNSLANGAYTMTSSESPKKFTIQSTNLFLDSVAGATVSIILQP